MNNESRKVEEEKPCPAYLRCLPVVAGVQNLPIIIENFITFSGRVAAELHFLRPSLYLEKLYNVVYQPITVLEYQTFRL